MEQSIQIFVQKLQGSSIVINAKKSDFIGSVKEKIKEK
jgi:hypothetical protein